MCQPRKMGTVGAEPFSAKLRYTGADDPEHPNLIKVGVTMPHMDGTWQLRAGRVGGVVCGTQGGGCSSGRVLPGFYPTCCRTPQHTCYLTFSSRFLISHLLPRLL